MSVKNLVNALVADETHPQAPNGGKHHLSGVDEKIVLDLLSRAKAKGNLMFVGCVMFLITLRYGSLRFKYGLRAGWRKFVADGTLSDHLVEVLLFGKALELLNLQLSGIVEKMSSTQTEYFEDLKALQLNAPVATRSAFFLRNLVAKGLVPAIDCNMAEISQPDFVAVLFPFLWETLGEPEGAYTRNGCAESIEKIGKSKFSKELKSSWLRGILNEGDIILYDEEFDWAFVALLDATDQDFAEVNEGRFLPWWKDRFKTQSQAFELDPSTAYFPQASGAEEIELELKRFEIPEVPKALQEKLQPAFNALEGLNSQLGDIEVQFKARKEFKKEKNSSAERVQRLTTELQKLEEQIAVKKMELKKAESILAGITDCNISVSDLELCAQEIQTQGKEILSKVGSFRAAFERMSALEQDVLNILSN